MNAGWVVNIMQWEQETGQSYPKCGSCNVLYADLNMGSSFLCDACYGKPVPDCEYCKNFIAGFRLNNGTFCCGECAKAMGIIR